MTPREQEIIALCKALAAKAGLPPAGQGEPEEPGEPDSISYPTTLDEARAEYDKDDRWLEEEDG